jgi:type I restriction enzyme S subunit
MSIKFSKRRSKFTFMEEWKEYRLKDITIMKNGKKRPQNSGQFPVYGGNGIMDYSDSYNSEKTIIVGRVGAYCGLLVSDKKLS